MAYQALYRQWRPKDFSSIVGQEAVVSTLRNQVVTGRIAHAYLFCGSRGTGKTSTSKILARAVNCQNPHNGDPCGECESCRRLLADESMDLMEFDAASNSRVENMRELLEPVNYPPQHGKYKVYIIDEVHMLSTSAFNALLKTLEEPPAHVIFILATTEPQKIPATILSRCQRYNFGRIPAIKIAGRLRMAADGANAEATDEALMMIARAAEGGMRDALSILDMCIGYDTKVTEELVTEVLGTTGKKFLFQFSRALENEDAAGIIQLVDNLMRDGKDPQVFAKDMSEHLRGLILAKFCPDEMTDVMEITQEDQQEYVTQADGFTEQRLLRILEMFQSVETALRNSASPRVVLETTALKACLRTKDTDTAALAERIGELENQMKELKGQIDSGVVVKAEQKPQKPIHPDNKPKEMKPMENADDAAVWKAMMKEIKTDSATFSLLQKGNFAGRDGDLFRWQPEPGNDIFVQILNRPGTKSAVSDILSKLTGRVCSFEAGIPKETPREEENETPRQLKDIFGAINVTEK